MPRSPPSSAPARTCGCSIAAPPATSPASRSSGSSRSRRAGAPERATRRSSSFCAPPRGRRPRRPLSAASGGRPPRLARGAGGRVRAARGTGPLARRGGRGGGRRAPFGKGPARADRAPPRRGGGAAARGGGTMKIHEYQAKELLRGFGAAVPHGHLALTPLEAEGAFRQLGGGLAVVKAQIHAGGRGKGGGVKLARSPEEAHQHAAAMLGMTLRTPQTGPDGQEVRKVYVEEGCQIAQELYLAVTLDREIGRVTLVASADGGMDIEEVAARSPERILKVAVDPVTGFQPHQARRLAFALGLA